MENIKPTTRECMGTDKPLISILMAVYEPRMDWLKEQLDSLEAQTYPNLRLYIRDDCSPTVPFKQIESLVAEHIKSIPYEINRSKTNQGSNLVFEQLTREAQGKYFAYCDQDDVWMPEKLEKLQSEIEKPNVLLVCSDMYIIDSDGKQVADSITKIRRHHKFRSGVGLTDTLWYSNFASGCALLVRSDVAKAAIPFNPYMYYDHYITLFSANMGAVISILKPLLKHREHGENQSSSLQGVIDKDSYLRIRVNRPAEAVQWLVEHFPCEGELKATLDNGLTWLRARQAYLAGQSGQIRTIWEYRGFSPMASLFEIAMPYLPLPVFKVFIWASKKNYV